MKTLAKKSQHKERLHARRKHRVNTTIKALSDEPRLIINRSNAHIYAQVVAADGKVMAVANDQNIKKGTKSEKAYQVGEAIAKQTIAQKITTVVFDRNGHLYHGRVKQLAE
jgi:large subunit ribosomal protein L18